MSFFRSLSVFVAVVAMLFTPVVAQETAEQQEAREKLAEVLSAAQVAQASEPLRPLVRHGRPFFPIGGFGFPRVEMDGRESFEVKFLRMVGWNTVLLGGLHDDLNKGRAILDDLHEQGMAVIVNLYQILHLGTLSDGSAAPPDVLRERIIRVVDAFKDHPAILGWYTFDEPENAYCRHPDFLEFCRRRQAEGKSPDLDVFINERCGWVKKTIREHDPNPEHYVFAVIAWWTCYEKLGEALVDVNMPNQYSNGEGVGEFGGNSEAMWYDAFQAATAARAYNGLGFVDVPWGTNLIGEPWRPTTHREFRYAVFVPMTQGAMGSIYWAAYRSRGPFVFQVILPVLSELNECVPFWLGQWHDEALNLKPDREIVREKYKAPALAGCVRQAEDGRTLVLVVNNLQEPIEATATLDLSYLPTVARDQLAAGSPFAIENGQITLPMEPLGVRALVLEPKAP